MIEKNISAAERTLDLLLRLPHKTLSLRAYGTLAARGFPDIRPAYSAVFRYITHSGSRVSELAARAHLTKQSISYLVEALALSGYVTIALSPADGRAKLVILTGRGREVSETSVALSHDVEKDFTVQPAPGEMRILRDLLSQFADVLETP